MDILLTKRRCISMIIHNNILLFLLFDIIFEIYEIYAYEYVMHVQNIKNNESCYVLFRHTIYMCR